MKNFRNPRNGAQYTAPAGGVTSGVPVVIGNRLLIPSTDAAEGEIFAADMEGVYELPKAAEDVTQNTKAYWDDANKQVLKTSAAGLYLIGTYAVSAASGETDVEVCVDGLIVEAVV